MSLRDQVDPHPMSFLDFVIALADSPGAAIPEADRPQVASVDGCVACLASDDTRGA